MIIKLTLIIVISKEKVFELILGTLKLKRPF